MTNQADEDRRVYVVVINDDEQYSVWSAERPIPAGWRDAGTRGTNAECLDHIEKVWTDMRPASVRRVVPAPQASAAPEPIRQAAGGKNELVARLETAQPITFVGRPEASRTELKAQLERGRIFIRFDETGTELGIKMSGPALASARTAVDGDAAHFKLEGELVLNYNRVNFVGEFDLRTLRGKGHLAYLGHAERA